MPTGGRLRALLLVLVLPAVAVGGGIAAVLTVDPVPAEEAVEPAPATAPIPGIPGIEQEGLPGSPYRVALDAYRRCLEVSAEPPTCGAPPDPRAYSMLGPRQFTPSTSTP